MSDDKLFFTSLIDPEVWDRAGWKGVFFKVPKDFKEPPLVALLFEHGEVGLQILQTWISELGERDKEEFLYLSFIEGELEGHLPGYSVVLSIEPKVALRHAHEQGIEMPLIGTFTRVHRMDTVDPQNLTMFKMAVGAVGSYRLGVARLTPRGVDTARATLTKTKVHFRQVEEVTQEHPDWAIFVKPPE